MKSKNILRIAALMLCLFCAAVALSSCDIFVEAFLSEYTAARTSERTEYPAPTHSVEETTSSPETAEETEATVTTPETTASPETEAETTKIPETTKAPEMTKAPETTAAPEVTEPAPSAEFADHVYLIAKDSGNCTELLGRVNVHVFMVSDTVSAWDNEAMNALKLSLEAQEKSLEADAKKYGKSLDITFSYTVVEISVLIDTSNTDDDWQEATLLTLGLKNLTSAQQMLQDRYGGDSNPIVFAVNKPGRAYASWTTGTRSERVTLFSSGNESFRHELCHLYGARDYYYPDEAKQLSDTYIPDSLMCNGKTVDALTAYLIGWDEELDDNAYAFLDATKHYTLDYLESEQSKQNVTGSVTNYALSYGTYTGYLERGVPNGVGKLIYPAGDVYEGNFVNGNRHGTGKYTWTSGNVYEGDWLGGVRTGKGTFTWASGAVYIGDYVDGNRHGKGKYIWPTGEVYEGDFVENDRTGRGTMTYTSGNVYTGAWLGGNRHGEGMMQYAAGHTYVGKWENGNRTGYGKMDWSDGSSYEGEWLDNKRHGYGKYINKNGTVFEGQWKNDVFQS